MYQFFTLWTPWFRNVVNNMFVKLNMAYGDSVVWVSVSWPMRAAWTPTSDKIFELARLLMDDGEAKTAVVFIEFPPIDFVSFSPQMFNGSGGHYFSSVSGKYSFFTFISFTYSV